MVSLGGTPSQRALRQPCICSGLSRSWQKPWQRTPPPPWPAGIAHGMQAAGPSCQCIEHSRDWLWDCFRRGADTGPNQAPCSQAGHLIFAHIGRKGQPTPSNTNAHAGCLPGPRPFHRLEQELRWMACLEAAWQLHGPLPPEPHPRSSRHPQPQCQLRVRAGLLPTRHSCRSVNASSREA